jgi:sirohydrochlorin cobaltochelatase
VGDFSDAALVIFGHGSTFNSDSGAPVFQHASELRRRKCFAEVREGFWKQEPRVIDLLPRLTAPRVFLAPLFTSEGYFSEKVIPKELGFDTDDCHQLRRFRVCGAQTIFYCRPVGTHERMTGVLLARGREVIEKFPFPRTPLPKAITLFIAAHGTEQDVNSRAAAERQAELIRATKIYADVKAVFLEEEPRIASCYQLAQTRNIVVVPFFISEGMHTREDIPVLLGEPGRIVQQRLHNGQPTWRNPTEKQGKLVWYASSVGTEPLMAEVILERVREAAGWVANESEPPMDTDTQE